MNFVKRGFLSILRRKTKVLILFAVIFILGNVISGAISIQQATGNVEESIKERIGASATLEIDHEALEELSEEEWMEIEFENLGTDLIEKIGNLSYVKYYDYTSMFWFASENLSYYQGENEEHDISFGSDYEFQFKGINYPAVSDIEEGKAKLVDGRVFNQEEIDNGATVGLISTKLAELNNVSVGDTIVFENKVMDYDTDDIDGTLIDAREVPIEVIGIFETQTLKEESEDGFDSFIDFMDIDFQNTIYTSNQVISNESRWRNQVYASVDEEYAEYYEEEEQNEYFRPIYVLNGPDDSEAFAEEVKPLLPPFYTVINAMDQYDNIAGPVESMSNLSGYVLTAAVIATVLIIGLVVLLFLRDRKHELGIYLSLGEKRARVVGQIVIEVMTVALIAITLSLFTGNLLASSVSDTLIEANQDQDQDFYYYSEFQTNLTTSDVIESYEVELSMQYVIIFYLVGLATVLVSTVIPLVYIVRLNPKKILM
ncbi:ABC transporter permease [Amphibacillus sediminis]|uniref:ABC transporter permease n=1 Tax=Amphibacillus sediminis TaxID=360185 RepID=UPI00082D3953|nr:ABC transporter permease [Amphibacillus sediminis]